MMKAYASAIRSNEMKKASSRLQLEPGLRKNLPVVETRQNPYRKVEYIDAIISVRVTR